MKVMPKNTLKKWKDIQYNAKKEFVDRFQLELGQRVLILCCGYGEEVFKVREIIGFQGEITAIDIDKRALEYARKRSKELGYKNIKFIERDAQDLKDQYGKFDRVCCLFGIHYFDDYETILSTWRKCLKKEGGSIGLATFLKSNQNNIIDKIYNFPSNYYTPEFEDATVPQKTRKVSNKKHWKNLREIYLSYDLDFKDTISYWRTIRKNTYFTNLRIILGNEFNKLEDEILQYINSINNPSIQEQIRIKFIYIDKA